MANGKRPVGVVTTAFGKGDPVPIRRSLDALKALGFERAILIVDVKDPKGHAGAKKAKRDFADEMEVRLLMVDDYGTARRWHHGIRKAFDDDPELAWVLHLPGDLIRDLTKKNLKGLGGMCKLAGERALVLGDYTSKERFKTWFDDGAGSPATALLYPEVEERIRQLGLTKRRTEFFCIGREVLAEHDRSVSVSWGQDPTTQLFAIAVQAGLRVERVHLGRIADDPGTRSPTGQLGQIVRFLHQMIEDRIIGEGAWSRQHRGTPQEQLQRHKELVQVLAGVYGEGMITPMIRDNAAEL